MPPTRAAGKPLPRGRHSLTREEVVRSQRERIIRGLAESVTEKGYARTTVADVLQAARVSRETFYEQFSSKEDCFMSAFEIAYEMLLTAAAAATAGPEGAETIAPMERFERGLAAYLDRLAAEPAYARVFLVEVNAVGPDAVRRRAELQRGFAEVLAQSLGATDADARFRAEALVAAIGQLVTARLVEDDVDGLLALKAPLVRLAERLIAP